MHNGTHHSQLPPILVQLLTTNLNYNYPMSTQKLKYASILPVHPISGVLATSSTLRSLLLILVGYAPYAIQHPLPFVGTCHFHCYPPTTYVWIWVENLWVCATSGSSCTRHRILFDPFFALHVTVWNLSPAGNDTVSPRFVLSFSFYFILQSSLSNYKTFTCSWLVHHAAILL